MTIAELKQASDQQLDTLFESMPEPSFQRATNTETESLGQIVAEFSAQTVSDEDRERLREKLVHLA